MDHRMIAPGDRIMIGISGGKDSLTLLNVMLHRRAIAPVDFDLLAVHVDSGIPGPDIPRLEAYIRSTGVAYHIESTNTFRTLDPSDSPHPDLNCFWCSWNRRKTLFQLADKMGFNKIALGHHLDDIVETVLLNQFFRGEISSMLPRQKFFGGKLAIIRPLAYENERMIIDFAKASGLSIYESCRCPLAGTTQREAVKRIIRSLEQVTPSVKKNIFNSLSNIKSEYLPDKM